MDSNACSLNAFISLRKKTFRTLHKTDMEQRMYKGIETERGNSDKLRALLGNCNTVVVFLLLVHPEHKP